MGKCRIGLSILVAMLVVAACAPAVIAPPAPTPRTASPVPTRAPSPTGTDVATAAVGTDPGERVTLADVLFVRARLQSDGVWTFEVTVQHEDTGREHYADRWEVLTSEGEVLATRVLAHPHVDEQPFARSQSGIVIPDGMNEVRVRAHDGVHGYGGRDVIVDLTTAGGQDFEVSRQGLIIFRRVGQSRPKPHLGKLRSSARLWQCW